MSGPRIVAFLACIACCAPLAAAGALRLRVESSHGVVIDDNGSGDLADAAVGEMFYGDSLGPFVGISLAATSEPDAAPLAAGEVSRLALSLVVTSFGPGSITLLLEDSNYSPGPLASGTFRVDTSGVLAAPDGSSIVVESWINPNNAAPALGASVYPAGFLDPIGGIPAGSLAGMGASFGAGAFASDNADRPVHVAFNGNYALFSRVTVHMTDAGMAVISLSGTVAGDPIATPEPTTLSMVILNCVPFVALACRRCRRRRRCDG